MKEPYLYYYYGALGKKPEFELGMVVMTKGIKEEVVNDPAYYDEVDRCFDRYIHKDLGVLGEEGDDGCIYEVIDGEEIMGAYETSKGISTSPPLTTEKARLFAYPKNVSFKCNVKE